MSFWAKLPEPTELSLFLLEGMPLARPLFPIMEGSSDGILPTPRAELPPGGFLSVIFLLLPLLISPWKNPVISFFDFSSITFPTAYAPAPAA